MDDVAGLDFALKPGSKFHSLSIPQAEADAALASTKEDGIVVFPCGAGKTALFVRAACRGCRNVLVLSYESQGVLQVADVVLKETDVDKEMLCVYTAEKRPRPNVLACFMCSTYSMFAGTSTRQSPATKSVADFVFTTQWDLIVCDEVQHAPADTFREVIEKLRVNKPKRMLGFTGTLCRSHLEPELLDRLRRNEITREQATEAHFGFVGRVLFRRSCADLEATGDIAKLHLVRVDTPAISHSAYFCRAHVLSENVTQKYLAAMHPAKLEALWAILHMHHFRGDQGMIFVDHLIHAAILKDLLGDRWGVLAGAEMHDMARSTSATSNRALVNKFNAGDLDGIIASPIGESSLDTCSERFRFIVVFDAHGGAAAASQRLGRAARTSRVARTDDMSSEDLVALQRLCQKTAFYYELVTPLTEEEAAADKRREQFEAEGYSIPTLKRGEFWCSMKDIKDQIAPFPYASEECQIRLLHRVLTHQDRQAAESAGRRAAQDVRIAHRDTVNMQKERVNNSKCSIFKQRHLEGVKRLQKQKTGIQAEANEERTRAIAAHNAPEDARQIFDQLKITAQRLEDLGLAY
jgi:superfamily II DNA or RNA helicase